MSKDDWAGGTNRRELILSSLTDKEKFNSSIREDLGHEDTISRSEKKNYLEALASRATVKDLADVIKQLNPDLAEDKGNWNFKYNPTYIGDIKDDVSEGTRQKINKLVDKYFSALRWKHLIGGIRESLYKFADIDKAFGTSIKESQKEALDDILINFTYRNKKVTTNILKKNTPFAVSDLGINKEESVYFKDKNLMNTHMKQLEKRISEWPNLESKLEPFIRKLKSLQISGKDEIKTMHPDMLIGRLSLKRLESRKEIYKYWREAHDDFNKYIEAQDEFHRILKEKLKFIGEQANDEKVMSKINANFKEYFDSKLEKSDNYIIEIPSKNIDVDDKSVQAMILLSEFLKMYMMQADSKLSHGFEMKEGEKYGTGSATGGEDRYDGAEWNPDIKIERDIISPDKDERTLAEQATMEVGQKSRVPKDAVTSIFGDIKSIKSLKRVDPLFLYAWEKGAFGRVPLFKKDVASIKRMVKMTAKRIDIFLEPSELDKLDDYFEELYEAATDFKDTDKFYLPLTPKVADLAERDDVNERFKKLQEHFNALKKMMSLGGMKDKAWPTSGRTRQKTHLPGKDKAPTSHYEVFAGRDKKGKNVLDIIGEFTNEYEDYMEALVEAFVIPLSSKHMPFDDEVEFLEEHQMRILRDEMKHPDAFASLLMRYHDLESATISVTGLKRLTKLMETISKPALQRRLVTLVDEMGNAAEELEEVFNFDHDRDIYIHFGKILQEIKEKNNIDETIDFKGKTTEEWAKKYDPKKTYPLDALESHLRAHKSTYESDVRFKRHRVIRKFFAALDSFDIVKMDLEAEVLIAHDNIRKMLNKPVYYNTSKVDNYDHVNYAIEVAKEDFKVELNATEIETIVGEFNSMEEIASKHGITQETVYFLKANFR